MTTPSEANLREYIRRVCKAMDYISAHLADNPTLDDIAEAAAFSKYHFHRVFKGVTGETVAEFTRRLRLERSAQMLAFDTSRDVTDIAMAVGFSSSQNFATAFRRHFGQSPSAFRAALAEQQSKISNAPGNDSNAESASAAYLSNWISQHWSAFERNQPMNVEVKELPAYNVAYVRHLGPYGEEGSAKAWGRLMQWAGPRGLAIMGGRMIGICWDSPELTPPDKIRYDACITVPPGTETSAEIGTQTVAGGKYAIYHAELTSEEFGDAWNRMMCEWLPQSGYQPDDRPCYEVYHNHADMHPEKKWIVDIHVPVRPL
jgi:AraC family transcriptional regulator